MVYCPTIHRWGECLAKFITIEGVEGAGKSTAINVVCDYFQQQRIDYCLTREPGGTPIAESIREVLLATSTEQLCAQTELLLMFASRVQNIENVIKPALSSGQWVISDRFTDASFAYQGGGREIAWDRIKTLQSWVQDGLQPDMTLLLDLPVEIGLERIAQRGNKDRIEQEDVEFFKRVRDAYHRCAEEDPKRYRIIDARQTEQQVAADICQLLASLH